MSEKISRRFFLSRSLLGLTALSMALPVKHPPVKVASGKKMPPYGKEPKLLHVAVDYSGPGITEARVLGLLVVAEATKHVDMIRKMRKEHKFFRALRHNSTDKNKLSFGNAVLVYFLRSEDMQFVAVVTPLTSSRKRKAALALAVDHLHQRGVGASLDPALAERAALVKKEKKGKAADDLGQLADILTGAVYVDLQSSTSTRTEFAKTLRKRLGVPRLTSLPNHPRFRVLT
jgi:hypothetical protein